MSAPRLSEVVGWDAFAVRGSVTVLGDLGGRLPSWRARVEAAGRQLETVECWSGPAATAAAGAVVELSTVAAAVSSALLRSLESLERMASEAMTAHGQAAEALALAAAAGVRLDDEGHPDPPVPLPSAAMTADEAGRLAARARIAEQAADLAAEARRRGALAMAAADEAQAALGLLGLRAATAPLTFPALAADVGPAGPVTLPPLTAGPDDVAAWWGALPMAARLAALTADPVRLGRLDGVPAWARDRANRLLLDRTLRIGSGSERAVAARVAAQLAAEEATGQHVQLLTFDPRGRGLAAVALGDLDTADAVGLLVPGVGNSIVTLPDLITDARRVADAARAAAPGLSVATVAWLGYATPQLTDPMRIAGDGAARRGGSALDGALRGLASARAAVGAPAARTTVIAHSYGTVVTDEAAERPGRLAADAVVLMGSPGMDPDGDLRSEVPELYDAIGGRDPIGVLPWFGGLVPMRGMSPWQPAYGAVELPSEPGMGHGAYYDPDRPTLAALGEVVAGTRSER